MTVSVQSEVLSGLEERGARFLRDLRESPGRPLLDRRISNQLLDALLGEIGACVDAHIPIRRVVVGLRDELGLDVSEATVYRRLRQSRTPARKRAKR
jgi:hypothetical protein